MNARLAQRLTATQHRAAPKGDDSGAPGRYRRGETDTNQPGTHGRVALTGARPSCMLTPWQAAR